VAAAIEAAQAERVAVCLTGGSTPEALYRRLAEAPYRERLPWARIHWFWGDERFVPAGDPLSNARMARRALLDHVPVPAENLHPIPTDAADPAEAARRYEAELKRFYGAETLAAERPLFDLVLMGMGLDGHTASLFPGSPLLDERERWVAPVAEARQEPYVSRVTLTLPAMASARLMLFLVAGAEKRPALDRVRAGEALPAARAWSDGALVWLADRAATGDADA
jgi:6-phosphogluconolactonase